MLIGTIYIQVSCTELLGFLLRSTLQDIRTGMQQLQAKAFIQPIQNRIDWVFVTPAHFYTHSNYEKLRSLCKPGENYGTTTHGKKYGVILPRFCL